jgi:hypothetical protein
MPERSLLFSVYNEPVEAKSKCMKMIVAHSAYHRKYVLQRRNQIVCLTIQDVVEFRAILHERCQLGLAVRQPGSRRSRFY